MLVCLVHSLHTHSLHRSTHTHSACKKGIIFRNGSTSRWKAPTFQEKLLKIVSESTYRKKIRTSSGNKLRAKNAEKSSLERASQRQGNRSYKLNIIKIVFFSVFTSTANNNHHYDCPQIPLVRTVHWSGVSRLPLRNSTNSRAT